MKRKTGDEVRRVAKVVVLFVLVTSLISAISVGESIDETTSVLNTFSYRHEETNGTGVVIGILIFAAGCLLAWILYVLITAFADLIDTNNEIAGICKYHFKETSNNQSNENQVDIVKYIKEQKNTKNEEQSKQSMEKQEKTAQLAILENNINKDNDVKVSVVRPRENSGCFFCGKKGEIFEYCIQDSKKGTRYRTCCTDCLNKILQEDN